MNKYSPENIWAFEVYGPFSRVIASFPIGSEELHHAAAERARKLCFELNKEGKKAWVRLKN